MNEYIKIIIHEYASCPQFYTPMDPKDFTCHLSDLFTDKQIYSQKCRVTASRWIY